jgi:putative DNA primase/helicase
MVRSPLVWLGEPDPVESMDLARDEDPELGDIRELFGLWPDYFDLDQKVTTGQIIELACQAPAANDFNRQPLKELLLRVAGDRDGGGGGISAKRLGWWLRGISGRVEAGHRLSMDRLDKSRACFWLTKVGT